MGPSGSANRPRIAEWVLAGYFAYTLALAFVLSLAGGARLMVLCASAGALATLHWFGRSSAARLPTLVRDGLPIAGVLLAYRQIGWFAQPQSDRALEAAWVRWDRLLLSEWRLQAAIESLGPVIPGALELLYLLTYVVAPAGLAILWALGRMDRADHLLAFFAASAVASYALYPYFPSETPRTLFPGDLVGNYDTVFRRFNWWILGGAGIHTSVFPSGHVSSAFGVGFGLLHALPRLKRYGVALTLVAVGIAVATVYGRYHYAVDALAGLAASGAASVACVIAFRRRLR